jgi:signal transduction histidine kinase
MPSFWPSTPFLVAVLLLSPRRTWPVLIAVGLGTSAILDLIHGTLIGFEIWFLLANLAEVLIATFGISTLSQGAPHLSSVETLAKYLAFAVVASSVAALLGVDRSVAGGYWLHWRLWVLADVLGFITVTPAILTWVSEGPAWARKSRNYFELWALLTLLVVFGYFAFMSTRRNELPALLYSLVPLLLWAALRLGLKGVSTSIILITSLGNWSAAHGRGPFAGEGPFGSVLSLQLFLLFAAVPFMFLAVLAGQQKQAEGDRIQMLEAIAHLNRVASLGQMAASLAHELAQPLASILSNAQAGFRFASRPEPNLEEIRGAFADITEDDHRARAVVQNTRAMFQRQAIAHTQVDLNRIVDDVGRLVKNEALRRGVQVRVALDPNAVIVVVEATALQQVILNLVNNGMDALRELPSGSRVLTLTTTRGTGSKFGTILVEDNGCGITKENRQRLFTPFFTTKTEGLGMGLLICRSLIESLGGHITLLDGSEPGTVFQVEVPLAAEQSLATSA